VRKRENSILGLAYRPVARILSFKDVQKNETGGKNESGLKMLLEANCCRQRVKRKVCLYN
jgi:hypothetical protein